MKNGNLSLKPVDSELNLTHASDRTKRAAHLGAGPSDELHDGPVRVTEEQDGEAAGGRIDHRDEDGVWGLGIKGPKGSGSLVDVLDRERDAIEALLVGAVR